MIDQERCTHGRNWMNWCQECHDVNVGRKNPPVDGVGPDAPIAVNENGGKQSASPYRCDLLPPLALLAVAKVLKHGAERYAPNNWRQISRADHINHAMTHILAFQAADESDNHLEHAACRLLMALETT